MCANMLKKTIDCALEIAEKCSVTDAEKHTIEILIRHAFDAYADAWKPQHNRRDTKSQWEYFYDELGRCKDLASCKQVKDDLTKYGSINDSWTRDFLAVMDIFLKAPSKNPVSFF